VARVPSEELLRIKREVSVERLAEVRGVKLQRHGADLLGLCPFHDDKEPSLVISPAKNLWHCLGACAAGGSVVDWVMRAEGISFRHAVELLREGLPVALASASRSPAVRSRALKLPPSVVVDAGDAEVLERVVGYYQETLKASPEALGYLASRGLVHPELIERFRLGFGNRTLGYRLPNRYTKAGRELRGRLQRLGLLRESGHEHFNGSLVVPVFDASGRVVEMYGRKVTPNLRSGTPLHLYLPGPHRGVFNLEALAASPEVILCESLIDALTFWCAGFRGVTSAYGVNGFTAEMEEAFLGHGVERVLISFDRDEAGDAAARKLAERLGSQGIGCWRVQFPKGMDANEYAVKVTPAAKSLDLVLRRAEWMGRGEPPERGPVVVVRSPAAVGVPAAARGGEAAKKETARPASPSASPASSSPAAASAAAAPEPPSLSVPEPPAAEVSAEAGSEAPASPAAERAAAPAGPGPASSLAASREGDVSPAESPPATLLPAPPAAELPVSVSEQEVVIAVGDRRYRVRGLARNLSYDVMKVNLLATRAEGFHVDTLDLYSARQRSAFVKQASLELGLEARVVKSDVGRVLLELERLQDEQIQRALAPPASPAVELSAAEREEALALLRDPRLVERILGAFERCGVVGEETNKLTAYLAAVSRKLERPLAVVVQSSSAAGKSVLLEAVLDFVPPEERVSYSAMTGQSLFYMGEADLKHKVLAVAEEEGAERASYALKLLQSEGELTIASTGKDPQTGRLVTHEYRVEGPVAILLTTTAIDVDEELLNRCLVLTVEESREQTRAIHRRQRERRTLGGLLAHREREAVVRRHRNAQRLVRPLAVVNPYAPALTFLDARTRTRRDHEKYLTLIESIALLHQHQRPVERVEHGGREVEYIEVTVEDIALANRLAHEVLGRSLDELPPQTRRLLEELDRLVGAECERQGIEREDLRFTRRWVREAVGWGDTQLKVHLGRLVELEHVLVHPAGHAQRHVYELVYRGEGEDGRPVLPGLIDVERLATTPNRSGSESNRSAPEADRSAPGRPPVGPRSGGGRGEESAEPAGDFADSGASAPEATLQAGQKTRRSYPSDGRRSGSSSLAARSAGSE